MNRWISRLFSKLDRVWFTICNQKRFCAMGAGVYLSSPFRIDGGEGIEIGERTVLQRGSWLYCCGIDGEGASLKFGKGCVFGYNNHITAVRDVKIGDNVLTANNVYISDNLHAYEDISRPVMHQPVRFKNKVSIGDGCWIGENVCIIGASVGRNSVIGANSVVTRDIPDYSVAVGSPAVVIKQYDHQLQLWVKVQNV